MNCSNSYHWLDIPAKPINCTYMQYQKKLTESVTNVWQ